MNKGKWCWELMILDGKADTDGLDSLAAADIDGDGKQEMIMGGNGGLVWYRPATFEKGLIAGGLVQFHVGIALDDVDGCGKPEVFVGEDPGKKDAWMLTWYKPGKDLRGPWERNIIDPVFGGAPHDILFADLDNDGENELVAIACYSPTPGIFAYKRSPGLKSPWKKFALSEGIFTEGLSVGDLNGDGKLEIVCGPDWYAQPQAGPFSGPWHRKVFAPNFREMCRTALADITGNGRPDIVITDSEYMDGFLSWFENRLLEDPANPWIEHRLEEGLVYSHSLDIKHNPQTGETLIFTAEMEQGGWSAPYNFDARLMTFATKDSGTTWEKEVLYKGEGTHQAKMYDIDGDGQWEIIGKIPDQYTHNPKVQIWKRRDKPTLNVSFKHRFLDRDKPVTAIEIMAADIDGDGRPDVACGSFWYKNPTWERHDIPGIYQVMNHYDLDKDGREEFIAIKRDPQAPAGDDYGALMSGELWWIKPVDPVNGKWEEHYIGKIDGDWAHGSAIAPLLPGKKLALITCYHNSQESGNLPELFEIPDDPRQAPWPKRGFAKVHYNEELIPFDIDNDGSLDVVAGQYWFDNQGDGSFKAYVTDEKSKAARIALSDINKNGKKDIIIAQEKMDYEKKHIPFSQLLWLENPIDSRQVPWRRHVIDVLRCAHSLGVADIDGDGEDEIIAGEHDPFWPYRKRCRLMVYKKADPQGTAWYRYCIDSRFEHHDGAKIFEMEPGRIGILSHGWQDKIYVHLWEVVKGG
ncbi:MAG: VCBS repeat-containing protein [Chitinivibrionales bacterium]|nr:VCBS repeat-containing protein [Chitinivibrionales bacterium]